MWTCKQRAFHGNILPPSSALMTMEAVYSYEMLVHLQIHMEFKGNIFMIKLNHYYKPLELFISFS
jgi:hypothetical protein